jgi:hypothetical protein
MTRGFAGKRAARATARGLVMDERLSAMMARELGRNRSVRSEIWKRSVDYGASFIYLREDEATHDVQIELGRHQRKVWW